MITSKVTKEQLAKWQELYTLKKDSLNPNRISGVQLNEYFRKKYIPVKQNNDYFKSMVYQNAKEYDSSIKLNIADILTYTIDENVFIGIDLLSGYFQVECEEIEKAIPIWDDLFLTRGLSKADLDNYVLVAQYILLLEK